MPETIKYIDPLVDFAFKKIFGSDPNKDLLIALLNEIFRGRKHIADLTFNKNEHPGDLVIDGGAIFDLLCTGDDGEQFIIEVQRGKQENFKDRALFYTSRVISNYAPKGRRSDWKYKLPEIYLVALLEDLIEGDYEDNHYLHDVCLCNRDNGKIFYDKLGYIYVELGKFVKHEDELETDLDKWLFVLKNMSSLNKIPVYLRKPVFEKLFNIAEYSNLTKEEKMSYDSFLKRKWDNDNVREYAIKEGVEKGVREGIEKAVEEAVGKAVEEAVGKAVKEAVDKAVKEAAYKARDDERAKSEIRIASEMKKNGMDIILIKKVTTLTIEEIEKLK